jgi:hypothetical protein
LGAEKVAPLANEDLHRFFAVTALNDLDGMQSRRLLAFVARGPLATQIVMHVVLPVSYRREREWSLSHRRLMLSLPAINKDYSIGECLSLSNDIRAD